MPWLFHLFYGSFVTLRGEQPRCTVAATSARKISVGDSFRPMPSMQSALASLGLFGKYPPSVFCTRAWCLQNGPNIPFPSVAQALVRRKLVLFAPRSHRTIFRAVLQGEAHGMPPCGLHGGEDGFSAMGAPTPSLQTLLMPHL